MTSQRGHGVKHSKSTAALYGHTYMATEFHLDLDCVVIADAISSLSETCFFLIILILHSLKASLKKSNYLHPAAQIGRFTVMGNLWV